MHSEDGGEGEVRPVVAADCERDRIIPNVMFLAQVYPSSKDTFHVCIVMRKLAVGTILGTYLCLIGIRTIAAPVPSLPRQYANVG